MNMTTGTAPYGEDDPADYLLSTDDLQAKQEKTKKQMAAETRLVFQYKRFSESEDGKAILKDLAILCFEDQDIFDNKHNYVNYCVGRRSVLVHIKAQIAKEIK
jgi:hypothetical protein